MSRLAVPVGPTVWSRAVGRFEFVSVAVSLLLMSACATPPPATPATESIVSLYQRAPERALINGLRLYEDGAFDPAEQALRAALLQGLRDRRDAAVAHKYLAFIACAFNRLAECEQRFRDALAVDPNFALSDAEIGHPIWGPVYRKVARPLVKP